MTIKSAMANYMLNINILDCENLIYNGNPVNNCNIFIRCHIQNNDDPYCETENIEQNANPNFNEEFEFSINDLENDKIIFENLHDDDENEINLCSPITYPIKDIKIGKDSVEKVSIPLQKDGQSVGTLNVQFKLVSKEKPQVYNASINPILLLINIAQVPNVQKTDENENIYLTFLLQGHDENETIKSIISMKALNSSWNQSFSLICNDPDHDILLIKMILGSQVLIDKKIEVNKISPEDKSRLDLSFGEDIVSGPLLINFSTKNISSISKSIVKVHIKILKGTDLRKKHHGKSNPYAKIIVCDKQAVTEVLKSTLNPEWNQEFDFISTDPINDKLTLQLFHKSKKTAADKKMMDPIYIPIRDLDPTTAKLPILYDVPLTYKNKAGHLSFEIYTESENLVVEKESNTEFNVEFSVLETNFIDSQNVNISYALESHKNETPKSIDINQSVSLKFKNLQDAIFFIFNNPETNKDLCDPFIVNLKEFSINEASEIDAETFINDGQKTGNIRIKLTITEIQNKNQENDDSNEPKSEINNLEDENVKLKARLNETNVHVSSLQSENQELKDENEKLKKRLNEMESNASLTEQKD